MNPLPQFVLNYIQEMQMTDHSPAFLKLTTDGILLDHGGDIKRFGIKQPVLNAAIDQTIFYLDGYFPLKSSSLILGNIETDQDVFADIHIFNQPPDFTWVLFLDKTENERKLRSILQKSNQLQLMEHEYQKLKQQRVNADILKLLDTAVFQLDEDGGFNIIDPLPDWFHQLFPREAGTNGSRKVNLVDYFPFLEFFLAGEAREHWETDSTKTILSDLWIENDADGKEYYLEAIAASLNQRKLLMIKIIDSETSRNFLHIQKGREKALAFEKAVKTQKMLREFMANMSHELRTPMSVIIGISNMLTRYYGENLSAKQTRGLELIHQSGQRLLRLINDLLDLSKIEAGKMSVQQLPTKLRPLIADTEPIVLSLLNEKDIRFTINESPDIPKEIDTDEDKLRQVLTNLLGNAVKFTHQGEITLEVYTRGNNLYFEVRDTGIGIGQDDLHHIFDAFTQVQSSMSREYGGTGLGLALCRKLITLLGGAITVQSTLNQGSTFSFYIPLNPRQEQPRPPDIQSARNTPDQSAEKGAIEKGDIESKTVMKTPKQEPGNSGGPDRPQHRVLIAEDEKIGRIITEMMLQKHYQLDFASDGNEALELFISFQPDVILMDIMMPGLSGYQAFDAIRATPGGANVPIIAMTAHAMEDEKNEILDHGFNHYLLKPVDEKQLISTIESFLNHSSPKRGEDGH